MVEQHASDEESHDKTFIEEPAILDKFKAAAQITDGKYFYSFISNRHAYFLPSS